MKVDGGISIVERIGALLDALPAHVGGIAPVYAVELRDADLLTRAWCERCANAAHVCASRCIRACRSPRAKAQRCARWMPLRKKVTIGG